MYLSMDVLSVGTSRYGSFLILILAGGLIAGCNKGSSTAHVSGKVTFADGSPLKGGVRVVRFEPTQDMPTDKRRVASGGIENDGSYELFTRKPGDGIIPGT